LLRAVMFEPPVLLLRRLLEQWKRWPLVSLLKGCGEE
jgi:hypothetical protein